MGAAENGGASEELGWGREAQDAREALEAAQGASSRPTSAEQGTRREPPSPRALTLVATSGSALAALIGWGEWAFGGDFLCSVAQEDRFSGANIEHAVQLVLGLGAASFLLAVLARSRPRLLLLDQLLMSAALLAGIALLALDSAVSRVVRSCLVSSGLATVHFYPLYVVWGAAVVTLLWQAKRLVRGPRGLSFPRQSSARGERAHGCRPSEHSMRSTP